MADATFILELRDRVSGAASKIARSMKILSDRFKRVRDAQGRFTERRGFSGLIDKIARRVPGAVALVAKLGVAFAGAAAAATAFGAVQVLKAGKFAEGLQFSLTRFLGDSDKAKAAIDDVLKISNKLGLAFEEAGTNFKDFISAGFSVEAAKEMLAFKADLIALGGGGAESQERINSAMTAISKGFATGRLEADQFNEILKNLPVTKAQVLQKLAKLTGKSFKELAKTDVTKLPVKELTKAFQLATLEATGAKKAGEVAAKRARATVGGAVDAIVARVRNLPSMIALAMGEVEGLLPLLNEFADFLGSAEAADMVKQIAEGFGEVLSAVVAARPFIEDLFGALKEGFGDPFAMFDDLSTSQDSIDGLKLTLEGLAIAVGFVARVFVSLAAGVAVVVQAFGTMVSGIEEAIGSIGGSLESAGPAMGASAGGIGTAIIDGIVQGIMSGASSVASAITGVAKGAISAAEDALGIASPSKVFEKIGRFTAQGFGDGLQGEASGISSATAGLVTPDIRGMVGAVSRSTSVSASVPTTINVNGAGDPQAVAAAVASLMQGELADAFEQIAISINAGPAPA